MTEIDIKAKAWDNLMRLLSHRGITLSYRQSVSFVGRRRLNELIAEGKLHETGGDAPNSKRCFRAEEILSHCKVI